MESWEGEGWKCTRVELFPSFTIRDVGAPGRDVLPVITKKQGRRVFTTTRKMVKKSVESEQGSDGRMEWEC